MFLSRGNFESEDQEIARQGVVNYILRAFGLSLILAIASALWFYFIWGRTPGFSWWDEFEFAGALWGAAVGTATLVAIIFVLRYKFRRNSK